MGSTDCLFCKIVAGEIPAEKVDQSESVTIFKDINPQAPIHYLLIPNTHIVSVAETEDPAIFAQVFQAARDIARKKNLSDYRLVTNIGAEAGQSVFHLHVHLLAGRPLTWPPG